MAEGKAKSGTKETARSKDKQGITVQEAFDTLVTRYLKEMQLGEWAVCVEAVPRTEMAPLAEAQVQLVRAGMKAVFQIAEDINPAMLQDAALHECVHLALAHLTGIIEMVVEHYVPPASQDLVARMIDEQEENTVRHLVRAMLYSAGGPMPAHAS